ncbi:2271_t:CDS:2 [Racocetra fulgida]|uniref:2271_t:CDS:1 n=1 Tax=Racocetra fulgida TaxID=60492 RepID=A0A9N9AHV4_9GLOM|nr:2271_t:CDS:2 [Racocetra fulgida]
MLNNDDESVNSNPELPELSEITVSQQEIGDKENNCKTVPTFQKIRNTRNNSWNNGD